MRKTLIYFVLLALVSVACSEKSQDPTPKTNLPSTPDGMYFKGTVSGTAYLFQNDKNDCHYFNFNAGFNKTANYSSTVRKGTTTTEKPYFQIQYGTVAYETDSLNFSSIFKVGKFLMGAQFSKPAYQFIYFDTNGRQYVSKKYAVEITSVADYSNKSVNSAFGPVSFPVATQIEGLITSAYLINSVDATDSVQVTDVGFRTIMSQMYETK